MPIKAAGGVMGLALCSGNLVWLMALVSVVTGLDCVKTGPCSCRTANGNIDLSPLASSGTARFNMVPDPQGTAYYSWNPCTSFSQPDNCDNVAACQFVYMVNETNNIGTQDSATFFTSPSGDLTLQYSYYGFGENRTTAVSLVCDESKEAELAVHGEEGEHFYSMTLTSKYACEK